MTFIDGTRVTKRRNGADLAAQFYLGFCSKSGTLTPRLWCQYNAHDPRCQL